MKRFFLFLPFLFPVSVFAQNTKAPTASTFATCLIQGDANDWWAGAEAEGLYHRDSAGTWAQFATKEQLGDESVTCVAVDGSHRVWVGTVNAGVAVYNGATWKRYGVWNGPLSTHINALEVDSTGTVWGATDAGLFRWSEKEGWQYPGSFATDAATREAARRPVYALAFESPTRVLTATDDGINRIELADGEARLSSVGRATSKLQPPRAQGEGFLPGPIHDVALDSEKRIWCATRYGVCVSADGGKTWQFLRGADWQANVKGSAVPLQIEAANAETDLLSEDWVTTLTPTKDGQMWLGFRQKGVEERDCHTLELLVSSLDDPNAATRPMVGGEWVSDIVPLGGVNAAIARYGNGLGTLFRANLPTTNEERVWPKAPLPDNAKVPPQLLVELTENLSNRVPMKAGEGSFYSLDRATRGDWPLRYGNAGFQLYGMEDTRFGCNQFSVRTDIGPHRAGDGNDFYTYIHWDKSDNPNVLQMPKRDVRTQAEYNDGTWQGGKYPYSFDGPGLWPTFEMPAGLWRVSLYWFNKDAHSGENRMRDHLIQLFSGDLSQEQCLKEKPLATARLWNGWNGEYASFVVNGPAKYQLYIPRDRSKGTISQGIFFDRLGALAPKPEWLMERLKMPTAPQNDNIIPAQKLWSACDQAETRGAPCPLERIIALRAAKEAGSPETLLNAWRIQAGLWDEEGTDRKAVALP